mmetsp:Transcript_16977/g.24598  ORF Transcript_16977/g.24598 Transcript_16977/m.24598 type:complete len:212 (+) Transcript_16977:58-693(+)
MSRASTKRGAITHEQREDRGDYDEMLLLDNVGLPYVPPQSAIAAIAPREENPVIFMDISANGGRLNKDGSISQPQLLGRLHFELRCDLIPVVCANFLSLIKGDKGHGRDGILYHYKGVRIHRIVRSRLFQSGDLLNTKGECSRSIYNNGGLFRDENFLLRHTGAGCLSLCNRGPGTIQVRLYAVRYAMPTIYMHIYTQNLKLLDVLVLSVK